MNIDSSIARSSDEFGNLQFPTRQDYSEYFLKKGIVHDEEAIWENQEFVSIIHRHWHGEGRNGCVFALLAARKAETVGWQDFVITKNIDSLENDNTISLLTGKIEEAIANPNCEILSLLFSRIVTTEELVRLICQLLRIELIHLTEEKEVDDLVTLAIRIPINEEGVLSWLMAFGPFDYFPQTRQSPITEIAIRVKPKPKIQFHRLTPDREAAHLADLPLDYSNKMMEKTWDNTLKRTRIILGREPDEISAAKTTFSLPKKHWSNKH